MFTLRRCMCQIYFYINYWLCLGNLFYFILYLFGKKTKLDVFERNQISYFRRNRDYLNISLFDDFFISFCENVTYF